MWVWVKTSGVAHRLNPHLGAMRGRIGWLLTTGCREQQEEKCNRTSARQTLARYPIAFRRHCWLGDARTPVVRSALHLRSGCQSRTAEDQLGSEHAYLPVAEAGRGSRRIARPSSTSRSSVPRRSATCSPNSARSTAPPNRARVSGRQRWRAHTRCCLGRERYMQSRRGPGPPPGRSHRTIPIGDAYLRMGEPRCTDTPTRPPHGAAVPARAWCGGPVGTERSALATPLVRRPPASRAPLPRGDRADQAGAPEGP
jgi:hypothetical protein